MLNFPDIVGVIQGNIITDIGGLLSAVWALIKLLIFLLKCLGILMKTGAASLYGAAVDLTAWTLGNGVNLLLSDPFSLVMDDSMLTVSDAADERFANFTMSRLAADVGLNLWVTAFKTAGCALTLVVFFYGFAESSIQLDKNHAQLSIIFSRIARWILAYGLVLVSYRMMGYLFLMFRSLYTSVTASSGVGGTVSVASDWFKTQLKNAGIGSSPGNDTGFDVNENDLWSGDYGDLSFMDSVNESMSIRSSAIGTIICLLAFIKLSKKVLEFFISILPSIARVMVLFFGAPLAIPFLAAPETASKTTQYFKTFAGAVLNNLLKVLALSLVTLLVCRATITLPGGTSHCILDAYHIISDLLTAAGVAGAEAEGLATSDEVCKEIAFLASSGGFLGLNLYLSLMQKTAEFSDRFSQEIVG